MMCRYIVVLYSDICDMTVLSNATYTFDFDTVDSVKVDFVASVYGMVTESVGLVREY